MNSTGIPGSLTTHIDPDVRSTGDAESGWGLFREGYSRQRGQHLCTWQGRTFAVVGAESWGHGGVGETNFLRMDLYPAVLPGLYLGH